MITEEFLEKLGIKIVTETTDNFLCYCILHHNTDTPALSINKEKGLFYCFSPNCQQSGNIEQLVMKVRGGNQFAARRFMSRYNKEDDALDRLTKILEHEPLKPFSQDLVDRMHHNLWGSPGEEYMIGRGFSVETLDYFKIGYSSKKYSITVPLYDFRGQALGFVCRTTFAKNYFMSKGLPISKTIWNLHNAKRQGSTLILTEASFDAARIHQAGYPNVGAILKGHISEHQIDYIHKYFTDVVMFADNDDSAGLKLGMEIQSKLNIPMRWCNLENYGDAKDASDMTDDQIRRVLKDIITHQEMLELLEIPG